MVEVACIGKAVTSIGVGSDLPRCSTAGATKTAHGQRQQLPLTPSHTLRLLSKDGTGSRSVMPSDGIFSRSCATSSHLRSMKWNSAHPLAACKWVGRA